MLARLCKAEHSWTQVAQVTHHGLGARGLAPAPPPLQGTSTQLANNLADVVQEVGSGAHLTVVNFQREQFGCQLGL